MRIAVVAAAKYPLVEPFAGGLEAHTHALVLGLRGRGHEVTVFAPGGSDRRLGAVDLEIGSFTSSPTARADVAAPPERWMREHHAYLKVMLELARAGRRRFDLVHDASLHHLPVAMAPTLEVPLVTALHSPPVPWLESAVALGASTGSFVTVSEAMARAWAPSVSCAVVPNGVDTDVWAPGTGGRRAVWAGRIVPEKAPHQAVLAARRAGMGIDLLGPVVDAAYFAEHVQPLLDHQARYLGHLTQGSARRVVGSARVAVLSPVWDEPFGLSAVEAMASGTPVAAFARGGLCEVVAPGAGALARPGDTASLAEAITAAARLDRRGVREHAVRCYSTRTMLEGYEGLYARSLGSVLVA